MIPLISAWFSIAMQSLLQLEPDFKRRLWFVVDELPSLQRLKDLETFLMEARKYGGCALLAIQSPAQLDMTYGRDATMTILGNCFTRIVFQENNPEVAERISRIFAEVEIRECQEGISYGAHEMRDGVFFSTQRRNRPAISPTLIQTLDKNQAYIKLAEEVQ